MTDNTARDAIGTILHSVACGCRDYGPNDEDHQYVDMADALIAAGYRPANEVAEECAQIAERVIAELINADVSIVTTAIRAAFPVTEDPRQHKEQSQ